MNGKAIIYNKRLCIALPTKANAIKPEQRFKTPHSKQVYIASKFEQGQLVARTAHGSRTHRFSIDYPLMVII